MLSHVVGRSIRPGLFALGLAVLGAGCAHAPGGKAGDKAGDAAGRSSEDGESAMRRDNAALRRRVQMLEDRMLRIERHAGGELAAAPATEPSRRSDARNREASRDLPVYQLEPETAGSGPQRPAVEPEPEPEYEAQADTRWDDPSGFAQAPEAEPEPEASAGAGSYRLVGTDLVRMTEPDKPKPADRPAPGRKGRSQKSQYEAALASLRAGDHGAAASAFGDFVAAHPRSDLADNALYWMGEAAYDQGHFADALASFTAVIERYAGGNKASDALLKIGLCYAKLGDNENARDVLHRLIEAYPGARASDVARVKLAELS